MIMEEGEAEAEVEVVTLEDNLEAGSETAAQPVSTQSIVGQSGAKPANFFNEFFQNTSKKELARSGKRKTSLYSGFCVLCVSDNLPCGKEFSGQDSYTNFQTHVLNNHKTHTVQ